MAKRRSNTKVTVVLKSRNPSDLYQFLLDVDDAIRPKTYEIVYGDETASDKQNESGGTLIPNEPLETKVREEAAATLDERNADPKIVQMFKEWTKDDAKRLVEITKKRAAAEAWTNAQLKAGWKVVTTLLATAKQVKDVFG